MFQKAALARRVFTQDPFAHYVISRNVFTAGHSCDTVCLVSVELSSGTGFLARTLSIHGGSIKEDFVPSTIIH